MGNPTTEQPATDGQPATLTDEDLQEVAAGTASQIVSGPLRPRRRAWWDDSSATLVDGSSGGSGIS